MIRSLPGRNATAPRRLLIDVTRTLDANLHSGIQRVVRGFYRGASAVSGNYRVSVHAVRCEGDQWLDVGPLPSHALEAGALTHPRNETPATVEPGTEPAALIVRPGDTLLLADAAWYLEPWPAIDALLAAGADVVAFIHDLLPLRQPRWFRPGTSERFEAYLRELGSRASRLVVSTTCIAGQVRALVSDELPVDVIPLASSLPVEPAATTAPSPVPATPFFLCVATLEPRKNHAMILDAFEKLWARDPRVQLVLVGAPGWCNDSLLERVASHPQRGRRLHWLRDVDDAGLTALYRAARALLYLPEDEGFGLPVLEARELGCPVIASDIPVLHEAGGSWPQFLPLGDENALLQALMASAERPMHGSSTRGAGNTNNAMHLQTRNWNDVASELLQNLWPLPAPAQASRDLLPELRRYG